MGACSRCHEKYMTVIAERDTALRELDAALSRAEPAELGCEIAYRREPTQAEGDAHEYRHEQSMGASEAIRECHVPMGNHHGHRCLCGRWVWGGPTVCQRCVDAEAVKAALLRADTDAKVAVEWKKLFNERNRLWREEADRVGAVTLLLEANGCDCDCDHDAESHDADCDRCLACRISWAIGDERVAALASLAKKSARQHARERGALDGADAQALALSTAERERDEARRERDMWRSECASISEEFNLPAGIRPSEGEISRFIKDYAEARKVRDEALASYQVYRELSGLSRVGESTGGDGSGSRQMVSELLALLRFRSLTGFP